MSSVFSIYLLDNLLDKLQVHFRQVVCGPALCTLALLSLIFQEILYSIWRWKRRRAQPAAITGYSQWL